MDSSNNMQTSGSSPKLNKTIGLFQACMFGIGLILGAGIYSLIGEAAGIAGNAVWISFIIAGVLTLIIGLGYAELSSMFPKSAAEYLFVKAAFKNEFLSLSVGSIVIFVIISSAATVAVGFSGYLSIFLPDIPKTIIATVLVGLLSFISFYGISESIKLNIVFTFIEIFGLLFIIVAAFAFGHVFNTDFLLIPIESPQLNPLSAFGLIFSAAALVFFAFFGFENLVNIADETKSPHKTIPKALIISIIVTTIIYILVAISAISLAGWQELYMSKGPLATAAQKVSGNLGIVTLSAIGLFATANTVLMMLISGSRMIFGISNVKKSQLLKYLTKVHIKRKTPWVSIVTVMLAAIAIIHVFEGSLFLIAGISVFCVLIVYIIINITLISLRYQKAIQIKNPVTPLRILKFSILPSLGIILCIAILIQLHHEIIKNAVISIISIFLSVLMIIKLTSYLDTKRKKK